MEGISTCSLFVEDSLQHLVLWTPTVSGLQERGLRKDLDFFNCGIPAVLPSLIQTSSRMTNAVNAIIIRVSQKQSTRSRGIIAKQTHNMSTITYTFPVLDQSL